MHHQNPSRWALACWPVIAVLVGAPHALAQPATYTAGAPLVFEPGTPKISAAFARVPDAKALVQGRFNIANADFNDDGRVEFVLQAADSEFCGSAGCGVYVIEVLPNKKMKVIFSQTLDGNLGLTQEKVGGYRALASLTEAGQIQRVDKKQTPRLAKLHGQQMVYPLTPP